MSHPPDSAGPNDLSLRFRQERHPDWSRSRENPPRWCHVGRRILPVSIVVALLGVTSVASLQEKPSIALAQEVRTGSLSFKIPNSIRRVEERHAGATHSVLFGEKDDCERYFQRYLGIFWSTSEVTNHQIIPSDEYKVISERHDSSVTIRHNERAASTNLDLSLTKRCGLVEKPELSIVRFKDSRTGKHFAVAAFIEPFLTRDILLAVAGSIVEHPTGHSTD